MEVTIKTLQEEIRQLKLRINNSVNIFDDDLESLSQKKENHIP